MLINMFLLVRRTRLKQHFLWKIHLKWRPAHTHKTLLCFYLYPVFLLLYKCSRLCIFPAILFVSCSFFLLLLLIITCVLLLFIFIFFSFIFFLLFSFCFFSCFFFIAFKFGGSLPGWCAFKQRFGIVLAWFWPCSAVAVAVAAYVLLGSMESSASVIFVPSPGK